MRGPKGALRVGDYGVKGSQRWDWLRIGGA